MVLTLLITLIFVLFINIDTDNKIPLSNRVNTLILSIFSGAIAGILITMLITYALTPSFYDDNDYILKESKIEQLQEIEPGIYANTNAANYSSEVKGINVIINDKLEVIRFDNTTIKLNSDKHEIEIRAYTFANPLIRWLLFVPNMKKHIIYTPQASLHGSFSIE